MSVDISLSFKCYYEYGLAWENVLWVCFALLLFVYPPLILFWFWFWANTRSCQKEIGEIYLRYIVMLYYIYRTIEGIVPSILLKIILLFKQKQKQKQK